MTSGEPSGNSARRASRCAGAGIALLAVVWLLAASGSAASSGRVTIQARARLPRGFRRLRETASTATIRGAVVLKPRDEPALRAFIAAATDPGSSAFHDYLSAGTFADRFGPTEAALSTVRAQLRDDGLSVGATMSDGLIVPFTGSAAKVTRAFATRLSDYALPGGGTGHATTAPVTLPPPVAGSVVAVLGLNDVLRERRIGPSGSPTPQQRRRFPRARSAKLTTPSGSASACPDAQLAARQLGGLTDDQIAHAYGADGLYADGDTGAGQHIGVYELEPFLRSDVRTFDTCYFGAAAAVQMQSRLHVIGVDGGQPIGPGSGEASLDVEDLSAIAPGAEIDVYTGPSPNANPNVYDAFDEYAAIIDADRDQIVSTSWGLCEQAVQTGQPGLQEAENELFQQAAAQGQTVFSAAGDNGSDDCNTNETPTPAAGQNPVSVDDPAAQPYVVGVGGTSIDDAASPRPLEQVWNDGPAFGGGGGGISASWTMPAWQRQLGLTGIALPGGSTYAIANRVEQATGYAPGFCQGSVPGATAATPCRLVPDVAAEGDQFTGAITVYSDEYKSSPLSPDGWTTIGGTSSATPIWAATLALVNASPTCAAQPATRSGVGFVSPQLYAVASDPSAYAASFNDIRHGSNDTYALADGRVFAATSGYDPASGLGSPELTDGGRAGLAYYLCSAASGGGGPTVTGVTPSAGSTAGGEQIRISGSGFSAHGAPQVGEVQVGSEPIAASRFKVLSATTILVRLPPARAGLPPAVTSGQDGAGPAIVTVTLRDGRSSPTGPRARFEYVDERDGAVRPAVGAVTPSGGLQSAGGTVTILGSGFAGARRVTFGGVPAPHFTVDSQNRITAVWPRMSSATACAALPSTGVYRGENARDDICQVQVTVDGPHGASADTRIRPPLQGAITPNALGVTTPADCHCEAAAATSEFDYLPRPRITSISTSGGARKLASERGRTVITVRGSGFDPLDIDWATFGDPRLDSSVALSYAFLSGTEMQIVAPKRARSAGIASTQMRVKTLAGQSGPQPVRYAGVPTVMKVVNLADPVNLHGLYGGPDTGRTPLALSGQGLAGQVLGVRFEAVDPEQLSLGAQSAFSVRGATLRTATVAENPALVDVAVCTVTGCTKPAPTDRFVLYPPGDPKVAAVTPNSGPAAGQTTTQISGENLGCVMQVLFGSAVAAPAPASPQPTATAPATQALPSCGASSSLTVLSPPGTAGTTVPVTVQTAESFFTRAPNGSGGAAASFSYR